MGVPPLPRDSIRLVLCGVVLAAGDSSRMGSPKALLADSEGVPFVVRIVRSMREAGLSDIVIVTGKHHDGIAETVARSAAGEGVRLVRNLEPARGQLSSVWTALDACASDAEAMVMTLVDVPMLAPSTIRQVVDAWRRTRAPIVRPAFGERRGHPVVFDRALFDELRGAPLAAGARVVVSAHYQEIVNVPVDDPACIVDIDTPDEYRRAVRSEQDVEPRIE